MKKNDRTTIIMSLVYVAIVIIGYGAYLRFGKGYSTFQAFQTLIMNVGNFLAILAFGLAVSVVFLLVSKQLSRRNRK